MIEPADMAATTRELQLLLDYLRETGVGALPVLGPSQSPPTEAELLADTERAVKRLYERHRRLQDGAGVVASLLAARPTEAERR